MDRLLSVEAASERMGLKPVTLRLWLSQRKLARVKLGRRVFIPESEVQRLIERNTIPALPER